MTIELYDGQKFTAQLIGIDEGTDLAVLKIKENGILFDCIDIDTKKKYELKKQKNDQWLDPSKFFNLSEDDKQITMVFILYDKNSGLCDMIATIS